MLSEFTRKILYVPFNTDYQVDDHIKKVLTIDEFFQNCFVPLDFEKRINQIENLGSEDMLDDSYDGTFMPEEERDDEISRLKEYNNSYENFCKWIEENGSSVYCVKGDAGTGKTTFLHYLKYSNKNKPIGWEIVDIQKSSFQVQVLDNIIYIPHFERLDYKVISALLNNITDQFFIKNEDGEYKFDLTVSNMLEIYEGYKQNVKQDFPLEEIKTFFENSPLYNLEKSQITHNELEEFADKIFKYISDLINTKAPAIILNVIWNIFSIILRSRNSKIKYIISFDNFERFVGTDEIFNSQLDQFIENLRHILEANYNRDINFYHKFQVILFMRNTSSRMTRIPLQSADFGGHELDLSGWFSIDEIVEKKSDWYNKNKIDIPYNDYIDLIFGKKSLDRKGYRSIQTKVNRLFNYNKRIILELLSGVFQSKNEVFLKTFDFFWENKKNMDPQLAKFAGRTIIIRLLLNELKKDGFFLNILVQNNEQNKFIRLGYARKILTILYNYDLSNRTLKDHAKYMHFDAFLQELRGNGIEYVESYFDDNAKIERETISQILYYMNYYNATDKNWLHFIDIQYNVSGEDNIVNVPDPKKLDDIIKNHHKDIGLRINTAGIAYLLYIVHSFEYFSCRVSSTDQPPLLCLIPSLDELRQYKYPEDLECIKVIDNVQKDAIECIKALRSKEGYNRILYRKTLNSQPVSHDKRIIFSHWGYINNFMDCLNSYYSGEQLDDELLVKKNRVMRILINRKARYMDLLNDTHGKIHSISFDTDVFDIN